MPDTYTPGLALVKPEIGASRDTWGSKTNGNWDVLDQHVTTASPIGMVADFAGPTAPAGWLICDGRAVSRTTYSNLFAVIGGYWGAGDGATTFNLPNLNGRSTIGPGAFTDQSGAGYNFTFTSAIGYVYQGIGQAQLPNYALYVDYQGTHSHGGASVAAGNHSHSTDAQGNHSHGGGTSNNNLDHYHTGTTDTQGWHVHNYTMPQWGNGNWVQGASGTQLQFVGAQTDNQGAHAHNMQTGGASTAHSHVIYADGSHAHNLSYPGDHQHGIYADGVHTHNVYLNGGGQGLEVLNPVLVITKIIYAGQQAATFLAAAAFDAAPTIDADPADELALIREELAALRAILAPPVRRVPHSPLRGPH